MAILDIDSAAAAAAATNLSPDGTRAFAVGGDVADQSYLEEALSAIRGQFGVPDVVVSNAGYQTFSDVWTLTDEEWERVFGVNVRGVFNTLRTFGGAMTDAGIQGSMITISSVKARFGAPLYAHYAASKAAVLSLTKSFALELAPHRIRVNSIAPGAIRTPLWERAAHEMAELVGRDPDTMRAERVQEIPLGRFGEPEDIAASALFLASADASYLTGECLHVCGGDLML